MRLNHNTLAFAAKNNLNAINNNLTRSMERLSSGYKINKSSDDPAAKAISQTMQAQIRGLERAELNANDGISLIQTAEGALNEVHSILQRMRELAVQGANETYDENDRGAMQDEIEQLKEELDRIADTTAFNGRSLLNGELNKKGYTDSDGLKIVEIGGDIEPGVYGINVASIGKQAVMSMKPMDAGSTVPAGISGTLYINDFPIKVKEGMTAEHINKEIRDAADKINIDYDMAGTFTTQGYGSKQSITLKGSDPSIETLFNVSGDKTNYGENAEVDFLKDSVSGERVGFFDTATLETQGNRITVTDTNGKKMVYEINPDADVTTGEMNITVLSAGPMVFQIGNNEGQVMNINIEKTTADSLDIPNINVFTHDYAMDALERLDAAIDKVSAIRSSLGAYQNRLDYTVTNLQTSNENLTSAVSRIMDTDMAEEITQYTQQNVLSQSALQMLTKSNARPEGLLQLFQR
ncbi:MAG: flagellar hook-associated protein FlgL [Eubacteriales bacterium]|nr:flagellar hook-associated protein FlgL [Eubacteriales bacterium]